MKGDSFVRLDARLHIRPKKSRSGFSTLISTVILVAAVTILGSAILIWANGTLSIEHERIVTVYANSSNTLRESFIVEDIWLSKNPADSINVTIRNIGDITIKIKEVNVTAVDTAGAKACTVPPATIPCTAKVIAPFPPSSSSGVINSTQTSTQILTIRVDNIDWDHTNSDSLNISITTERGTIETISWKVKK